MSILKLTRNYKLLFHFIFALVFGIFLMVFIHEIGHCIVALIFNFEIIDFQINLFENSFIMVLIPGGTEDWKIYLFKISGTLITLIFGLIFTIAYYKYRLPALLEYTFYVFSFLFFMDFIFYLPIDLLFLHEGDWWDAYQLYPELTILLSLIPISELVFYYFYRKKLFEQVNYDFSE